jgi:hypothetical protein
MSPLNPKIQYNGFTLHASPPPRELLTPVKIRIPLIYQGVSHDWINTIALWDTGATNSVIRDELAKKLSLSTIGKAKTWGIHGPEVVDVFLLDILLMERVQFTSWRVSVGDTGPALPNKEPPGVIIGMDIITQGDLTLMRSPTETLFSFIIPSIHDPKDFSGLIGAQNAAMRLKQLRAPSTKQGRKHPRGR